MCSANEIGDTAAASLAEALKACPQLQILGLSSEFMRAAVDLCVLVSWQLLWALAAVVRGCCVVLLYMYCRWCCVRCPVLRPSRCVCISIVANVYAFFLHHRLFAMVCVWSTV